jgi:hypothetical protein
MLCTCLGGLIPSERVRGEVIFSNVYFAYPSRPDIDILKVSIPFVVFWVAQKKNNPKENIQNSNIPDP